MRLLMALSLVAGGMAVIPALPAQAGAMVPECPVTIHCVLAPAAYHNNDPADPVNYGNYDTANRPADGMQINSVVIHDIEGTCEVAVKLFQDPLYFVSAHYVICADGTVYQMVSTKNVAWHARNWWYNMHSIGIEHAGHAALGAAEYTPAMYNASAKLVRYLAAKYHFSLDRGHIIGHDNVPATTGGGIASMHKDPGPFWNWQLYMGLLGAPVLPTGNPLTSTMITVAPVWPLNKQPVTGCSPSGACVPSGGPFVTNMAYLHTQPDLASPLLSDAVTGPGTTEVENITARVTYGQQFAVADRRIVSAGIWYKIWYSAQAAWLYSPFAAPTALAATGQCAKPKEMGATVYGRPLPEQSEYPADFAPPAGAVPYPTPYPYTIAADQCYAVVSGPTPTDFYFAWTYNSSLPYDHTRFTGSTEYVRIWFNARQAFVKRSQVMLVA
jgi:N-acetyl-anhydromuramyl-L-alanine amidase AmpD